MAIHHSDSQSELSTRGPRNENHANSIGENTSPKIPPLRLYQKQNKNQNSTTEIRKKKKKSERQKNDSTSSLQCCKGAAVYELNEVKSQPVKKVSLPALGCVEYYNSPAMLERGTNHHKKQSLTSSSRGCSSLPPLSNDRGYLIQALANHSDDDFCQSINIPAKSYSYNKLPLIRNKSHSYPDLQKHVNSVRSSPESSGESDYEGLDESPKPENFPPPPGSSTLQQKNKITLPRLG